MQRDEYTERAETIRLRDRFGSLDADELASLPATETEIAIPAGSRTVRVFDIRPKRTLPTPHALVVNFHGGGFIKGRADRDKRYCAYLADTLNCVVWDVDYRLAPENPFPAALDDSYAVADHIFTHATEFGVGPRRIALAGHSAGGNLICAAMLRDANTHRLSPCCLLLEYFPADQVRAPAGKLTAQMRSDPWWVQRAQTEADYALFYATPEELRNPLCSPLLASPGAFTGFPPTLILSAGVDLLRDEGEEMAARLISEGVETTARRFVQSVHGFTINRTEEWEQALDLHCRFLRQYL